MILVDSSVWIDYFNGHPTAQTSFLDGLLAERTPLLGDLILAEVLQGFRSELDFHRARRDLSILPFVALGGRAIATAAARNYRVMRAKGVTIRSTIDTLIATFCISEGHQLLHSDHDFDPFEHHLGLRVIRA